jgi:hypothetical protein
LSFEVEARSKGVPPAEQREYQDSDIPF